MNQVYRIVIYFLFGIIIGILVIFLSFGDYYDQLLFKKPANIMIGGNLNDSKYIIYEMRKLVESLNNSRYIHVDGQGMSTVLSDNRNGSIKVPGGR